MLEGIDVSHFQGDIAFAKVKAAGKSFVFAKASEGTSYVDPMYKYNKPQAMEAGLTFGAYHFFSPDEDGVDQAEHYLRASGLEDGMMHAVLDLEAAPQTDGYTARVKAWIDKIYAATGQNPILYSNPSFWNQYLGDFDRYVLWLADYASEPTLPNGVEQWVFWQYSQSGTVNGVDGAVDLDQFNGDADQLASFVLK